MEREGSGSVGALERRERGVRLSGSPGEEREGSGLVGALERNRGVRLSGSPGEELRGVRLSRVGALERRGERGVRLSEWAARIQYLTIALGQSIQCSNITASFVNPISSP